MMDMPGYSYPLSRFVAASPKLEEIEFRISSVNGPLVAAAAPSLHI